MANHTSRYDVLFCVTRLIWSQSRIMLLILGQSRIMQKPFATLLSVPQPKLHHIYKEGNLTSYHSLSFLNHVYINCSVFSLCVYSDVTIDQE